MKKIVAVNAGPRKGYNTDSLVREAARGAADAGAGVEIIDLYDLDGYQGCRSCFACKLEKSFGKCAFRDGLSPVLDSIRESDGLIIGSPNYLGNLTAGARALYERLVFQSLTYNRQMPSCNDHMIPVLLITTSNCGEELYDRIGYTAMLDGYKSMLDRYVGETVLMVYGNTLQVKDYSIYNWTNFDPEAKKAEHDAVYPEKLKEAYRYGMTLFAAEE